jgi:UPF0755 protein
MSDDLGLFGEGNEEGARRRGVSRRERRRARKQSARLRRRRRIMVGMALVVLLVFGGAALYGVRYVQKLREIPDYPGPGGVGLVVQVKEGQNLSEIGATLVRRNVVASVKAFTVAAQADPRIQRVQPGYYQVRDHMSGAGAVAQLLTPAARVGQLEIRGGEQLDDVNLPNGQQVPGLLSELSRASCAQIAGRSTCVSAASLRTAMARTDPAELGVPNWAADPMARVEPGRKLEGVLLPGRYDVRPGSSAEELLRQVAEPSVTRLLAGGLPSSAAGTGYSPYEVLVIASMIEREAIQPDFGRVSRVIYNRLADGIQLQLDSTINYPLDRQQVRTSDADRARPGPYNTYLNRGLPASPIGAPSTAAVEAATSPEAGPWHFFVKCQRDGKSCFSVTIQEHQAAVRDALARGVF